MIVSNYILPFQVVLAAVLSLGNHRVASKTSSGFPFLLALFASSGSVGAASASAAAACNQKGVLMVECDELHAGELQMVSEDFRNSRFNAFINQQHDGNLVVTRGTPSQREGVLWASGVVHSKYDESYYTTMEHDGNLVTRHQNAVLWETACAGDTNGSYVLALDCDGKSISIYSGDTVVWTEPTRFLDLPPPPTATPTAGPAPTAPLVVYATGDICDPVRSSPGCADTAAIISQEESSNVHVLPLGDLAYSSGTIDEYNQNYETYWGPFKDKSYPVPGNHENLDEHSGYYEYWGQSGNRSTKPGQQGEGFYSFDLGTSWHFVALNTNDWDSTQSDWLKEDLEENTRPCILVYGHHPRYSPGKYGPYGPSGVPSMMNEVSQILAENAVDIYLAGHDHIYARYAKQDADGTADAFGTAHIVAGTGGFNTQLVYNQTMENMEAWFTADPDNALSSGPFGLVRLELRDGDYEVSFLVTEGDFMDSQRATSCNRGLYP